MKTTPKVVINNGFGQFHLARLAETLYSYGMLRGFLTGGYPKGLSPQLLTPARHFSVFNRFAEREIDVPGELVRSCWAGEIPHQVSQVARSRGGVGLVELSTALSMDLYSNWARNRLKSMKADLYHFRAGMGGESVQVAKDLGMPTVCDHSIAHPRLLDGLVDGTGSVSVELDALWSRVEKDIERADWLLVNSDFVAQTCIQAGVPAGKISVAYTAVDPNFLRAVDGHIVHGKSQRVSILFAGTLEKRKGVDVVVEACRRLADANVDCVLVGEWAHDSSEHRRSLPDNIEHLAKVPRAELGRLMAQAEIFVFPTRAEGSARVVAEALTAGCYVVTTANAGSVVRDGVDGRLVPVDDPAAVEAAVREYLDLSNEAKKSQAIDTRTYARARLSEDIYAEGVYEAYRSVSSIA